MKFKWIKKNKEEIPKVKTDYRDVWCVEVTLRYVIVSLLETLKDKHHSYPFEFKDDSEWVAELENGIKLFNSIDLAEGDYAEKINSAYNWLSKWLPDLWD